MTNAVWEVRQQGDHLEATSGRIDVRVTDEWQLEVETQHNGENVFLYIPVSVLERLLADRRENVRDAFRQSPGPSRFAVRRAG